MRIILSIMILSAMLTCGVSPVSAQQKKDVKTEKVSPADKKAWFKEMRELKHQFLIKELQLTKEQQKDFFPLYDKMEDEIHKLNRETRAMERKVCENAGTSTDLDYEKASEALFELKVKEGTIEQNYAKEFGKILSPRQLFMLKGAEREYARRLIERHQKMKGK